MNSYYKELDKVKIGDRLVRKDNGEIVDVTGIIREDDGRPNDYYFKFFGCTVHRKVMTRFFETDLLKNLRIVENE